MEVSPECDHGPDAVHSCHECSKSIADKLRAERDLAWGLCGVYRHGLKLADREMFVLVERLIAVTRNR